MIHPLLALLIAAVAAAILWLLFRPGRGLWRQWREASTVTGRVRREDALKHLYLCQTERREPTVEGLAGALHLTRDAAVDLLRDLQQDGLLEISGGRMKLTATGQTSAVHIIRAHRLWERYLADETGFQQEEWHDRAEAREHAISPQEADRLAAALGNPTHDPHGDPIPTSSGMVYEHGGKPLSAAAEDRPLRVVHVEDEPQIIYAQLVAAGIHPGMVIRIVESTPSRVRFLSQGNEHVLAPIVAGNVSVLEMAEDTQRVGEEASETLAQLSVGESAEVTGLSPVCVGAERRRFLDLGILPGTRIAAELRSPGGDPTAYLIRGALVALRREQASLINVRRSTAAAS
jgi:DtxR family Mn-dependent transcriptional regulator